MTAKTEGPTLADEIVLEVMHSPERSAKLKEIEQRLTVAVAEAADGLHEVLMGDKSDSGRKLAAALMSREHIERLVSKVLSAKAGERGPILP